MFLHIYLQKPSNATAYQNDYSKIKAYEPPSWNLGSQLQKTPQISHLLPSRGTKPETSYAAELHQQDSTKLD